MISGTQFVILRFHVLIVSKQVNVEPLFRRYTATSAQNAVTFMYLDFTGMSVTYNSLRPTLCPSGFRAQIVSSLTTSKDDIENGFPKLLGSKGPERSLLSQLSNVHNINLDSVDHMSHVTFLSGQ